MQKIAEKSGSQALFVGSKSIGLKALQALIKAIPGQVAGAVTFDDSLDARSVLQEIRAFCESVKLPLVIITKPSDLTAQVKKFSPHFVLVVGWYWIIDADLLRTVPGGFVGAHASLLPRYRGNAPLVWAILQGETESGVTLFCFDEGMDTGDIIGQLRFPIGPTDTIAEVLQKAEETTIKLVSTHALSLLSDKVHRQLQDHSLASYASLRRPEDGRIDWQRPAREIYNFIRAQTHPYPGAFSTLPDGTTVRIWGVSLFPYPYHGIPGLVGQKNGNGVVVTCGQDAIVINDCEVDGNDSISPSSVLKWGMKLG